MSEKLIKTFKSTFQCSSDTELAELLNSSRSIIARIKKDTAGKVLTRPYQIIEILIDEMPPENLKKCVLKIHKLT